MKQTTFASMAWAATGKTTRRERFLAEMNAVIPWSRLAALRGTATVNHVPLQRVVSHQPISCAYRTSWPWRQSDSMTLAICT